MTGSDKIIKVWDLERKKCLNNLHAKTTAYSVKFQDDKLVAGGKDKLLHLWDLETCVHLQSLEGHKSWLSALQLSHNVVVSGGGDGRVIIWYVD
jgi:WD40 repeat protein